MKATSKIIWGKKPPYVRKFIEADGTVWYQCDNRKAGTDGKRQRFETEKAAMERAREILKDMEEHGYGAVLPFQLRAMAQRCAERLDAYGRTIEQATDHFIAHLEAERVRSNSALVPGLIDLWVADLEADTDLAEISLRDLKSMGENLKKEFPTRRVAEIETDEIKAFLNRNNRSKTTKRNLRVRAAQFFNWCISKKWLAPNGNPASGEKIEINVEAPDVVILPVGDCETIMRLTETPKFADMMAYFAVSIFAGVRPFEARRLEWKNVHLETRQIVIHKEISKVSETRYVHIEDTLLAWLKECHKKTGFVAPQKGFRNRFDAIRKAAGYAVRGEEGKEWVQDSCRHSYATFWLPANEGKRAQLAEYMGNSSKIIGNHYKLVVPPADVKAFWNILPPAEVIRRDEEAKKAALAKSNCSKVEKVDGKWQPVMREPNVYEIARGGKTF